MVEASLRFDRFCWNVRLARTRAIAVDLAQAGHVRLNGRRVEKPSIPVHAGDILTLPQDAGVRVVRILALPTRRVGAKLAAQMIEDIDGSASPS